MEYISIKRHYLDPSVASEIVDYSKDKWIGIHCIEVDERGKQIFHRYSSDKPLKISSYEDLKELFELYPDCRPRTIYASINQYRQLDSRDELYNLDNIYATSPIWDIDNVISDWRASIEIAKWIVDFLRDYGIRESIFIKWSGEGMHIHLHPGSISREIFEKIHPLDAAYSIVEYVMVQAYDYLEYIKREYNADNLKIENKIDISRVFTTPLSIHRRLDRVAICIKPENINAFRLSWTEPGRFKHDKRWRRYKVGESDELIQRSFEKIGGYPYPIKRRRRGRSVDEMIRRWLKEI